MLVGTSLQPFKLVGFIYVPARRRDDVKVRSRSLKWVNFIWVLSSTFLGHFRWFSLIKVPAGTPLKRLEDVGLI